MNTQPENHYLTILKESWDRLTDAERAAVETIPRLSRRERQVLALLQFGDSNKAIAERLGITQKNVEAVITRIFRKLGVANRTGAALAWERSVCLWPAVIRIRFSPQ